MIGDLAVSFCERNAGKSCFCLDLWSYPDGTYNLVIDHPGHPGCADVSFPCSLAQLSGVLSRKTFEVNTEEGTLCIERCRGSICAHFSRPDGEILFTQCIPAEQYQSAIEALQDNLLGYLA